MCGTPYLEGEDGDFVELERRGIDILHALYALNHLDGLGDR